jgi:hypothetical protein
LHYETKKRPAIAKPPGPCNWIEMEHDVQQEPMELPPGFRFHPTDEELITHYLARKTAHPRFAPLAVGEADLNKCEPWDLPCKSILS